MSFVVQSTEETDVCPKVRQIAPQILRHETSGDSSNNVQEVGASCCRLAFEYSRTFDRFFKFGFDLHSCRDLCRNSCLYLCLCLCPCLFLFSRFPQRYHLHVTVSSRGLLESWTWISHSAKKLATCQTCRSYMRILAMNESRNGKKSMHAALKLNDSAHPLVQNAANHPLTIMLPISTRSRILFLCCPATRLPRSSSHQWAQTQRAHCPLLPASALLRLFVL